MISIIMSVFSEPIIWLEESINSILNQSYKDFEFVIVCDNPENKDAQIVIKKYSEKDERIVPILNDSNLGLTKSLNKGLDISKGEFIARMDADDIAHPDRLSKQVCFLVEHPQISICSTDARIIDDNSNIIAKTKVHGQIIIENLYRHSPIIHPTVMFRRSLLKLRNPFYNEQYKVSQDYELWTFLYLSNIKFAIIAESLLDYRISSKQISKQRYDLQIKNSSQIASNFYVKMLAKLIPGVGGLSFSEQIDVLSKSIARVPGDEQKMYLELLYRQYYTALRKDKKYILKYIADSNKLIIKLPFRKTIYMLLSLFAKNRYNQFLLYF